VLRRWDVAGSDHEVTLLPNRSTTRVVPSRSVRVKALYHFELNLSTYWLVDTTDRQAFNQAMKGPKHYDRALVPEHLTKQTIELLPFDQAYYISPGERDDYEPPAIFVTPERKLVMSRSHDIDVDDAYPESPIGLVGVMHVTYVDPESQALRDAYIADLRFISDNALVDVDPGNCDAENQEEYMGYLDMLNDTIEFDAFIAPELFEEPKKGKVTIPGVFYGNPVLHPELKDRKSVV